jgi:hypothetical protein
MNFSDLTFIEMLRFELARLEEAPGVDPKDPKILQFKTSILQTIVELEGHKSKAA